MISWELLNIIGTIAFALSGVIVAMEERYDIIGVYILGFVTAFGGGAVRNLLIGVPVSALWDQELLFTIAFLLMTVAFFLPQIWFRHWTKWGVLFDAVGLAAFAVQGAIFAAQMNLPLSAAIAAAALTGAGGGIIRDLLAGRRPLVLSRDIYVAWTIPAGLLIGSGLVDQFFGYVIILAAIVTLRMLSVYYNWQLPRKQLPSS